MPQSYDAGTLAQLSSPYTSLDKVPTMANYLPRHSFNPNHPGDNNIRALSKGASHTVQHIQGAMDNTPAHPQPTQTPAANEAEEAMG